MTITCPKCQHDNPDDTLYCGKCATSLPSSEEIAVTETIEAPKEELTRGTTLANRYEIIEELGKGGMGRVYRVEDTRLKQEIALKLIKPEIAKDKKIIERFRNELKLAREIAHRNVCRMYDLNEEEGAHYITMEYVRGEDLRGLIRRIGQLPIGKSISIANQICEGLAEAHRLGVVHRDLKSSNIMIDNDGNVRIMDFGIARSLETKGITGAGVMIGTPEYMSPEQVEGKEVDQRSDIYSLGVILYEMVTGRVPFEGDTPFTIGVKHKSEIPKDPQELNTQISDDLSRVILRCLEKDKEKRYQSAGEVRSELTNIEKGMPTTERMIPERKPLTSREITVQFSLKKALLPALIFIAIVLIGVVIWQFLPRQKTAPIPTDKPSLAVMHFKNNTGDPNLDHWSVALSDLLITDLSQSKYMKVLSGERLNHILDQLNLSELQSYSSEELKEVASRGGVANILIGNFTKAGENFRINITLQDGKTGELIASERTDGSGEQSFYTMVDDLTRKIKEDLKLTSTQIASDLDKEVEKITTSSPEAYKFYAEGRKYHNQLEYERSIESMEKAIALDPEFAMAYRSLSVSHTNLGKYKEANRFIQKALELSDRMTERERLTIKGEFYSQSDMTYDKAIEAYRELLNLYPEDTIANHNLALRYRALEEWDKAIEYFNASIMANTDFILTYTNLASSYKRKGLYDKAIEVYEECIRNFPDDPRGHFNLGALYAFQGKNDLALNEMDKAITINPTFSKGTIYLLMNNYEEAEKEFKKVLGLTNERQHLSPRIWLEVLYRTQGKYEEAEGQAQMGVELTQKLGLEHSNWKLFYHRILAYLYGKSEDFEKALNEIDKAWQMSVELPWIYDQIVNLWIKGRIYSEMDSLDEAQETAEELRNLIQNSLYKKHIRYYHQLMGVIELKKANYAVAIDYFNKTISLVPYPSSWGEEIGFHMYYLALAYYESGDLDRAREEFEKITAMTNGRLYWGDLYAKSFYMLGKIYEEQRNTAKAIDYYEKFLDLWKDADPGIAEVEDTKERLAGLKENV
jgi:serine/threonine protein kinase/lipopolysaccharide biosynthesis regulator YciM